MNNLESEIRGALKELLLRHDRFLGVPDYAVDRFVEKVLDAASRADLRARVRCDEGCGAFYTPDPDNLEELRAAYDHWANHQESNGCSHGC